MSQISLTLFPICTVHGVSAFQRGYTNTAIVSNDWPKFTHALAQRFGTLPAEFLDKPTGPYILVTVRFVCSGSGGSPVIKVHSFQNLIEVAGHMGNLWASVSENFVDSSTILEFLSEKGDFQLA
ncbi:MAG TPA: hypothetical protein VEA59_06780 [Patescibacteria group bacterium]|nr:hypothetical protein [Patescibacteria group bacterium]